MSIGWYRLLAYTLLGVSLCSGTSRAEDSDGARELVQRMRDSAPKDPFFARVTLSSSLGWKKQLEMSHKKVGDTVATYIDVTAPQDAVGTRFLFLEHDNVPDEQYLMVPNVKRAVQIAEGARKQSFLGSDFLVSDLVAEPLDNFTFRFAGEEDVAGHKCKIVETVPKNPEGQLYSKTLTAIDVQDLVVLRTQFFDPKGKLLKTWTIENLEKIDGNWTPRKQRVENVQTESSSEMEITEIDYKADLPDQVFGRQHFLR